MSKVEKAAGSGFRKLQVWQKAMALASEIYKLTEAFPTHERFGLAMQMRRAAISIASNIAEGHGRRTSGEFLNFLSIARGSACELETQLELSERLQLIESATNQLGDVQELTRMLSSLMIAKPTRERF